MSSFRKPSPARSVGNEISKKPLPPRRSRSVNSPTPSNASVRLSTVIQEYNERNTGSFVLSPLPRKSVLTDNTNIEEPRRQSWWQMLDENSREFIDIMDNQHPEPSTNVEQNIMEELDLEILSQEKRNFTLDLPESSDNESINSIVLPQRKLFTEKQHIPQQKFGMIKNNRATLAKINKTTTKDVVMPPPKKLFQNVSSKPVFPEALLASPNTTATDSPQIMPEPQPKVRNLFGHNQGIKRKNMLANYNFIIESENEADVSDIQPKVFGFQKKSDGKHALRKRSSILSNTTDMELDDWRQLPSSTMVDNQLEAMIDGKTPNRERLSKLSEAKESDTASNATVNKSKQSNKSSARNKSIEDKENSLNKSINRSHVKSKNVNVPQEDEMEVDNEQDNPQIENYERLVQNNKDEDRQIESEQENYSRQVDAQKCDQLGKMNQSKDEQQVETEQENDNQHVEIEHKNNDKQVHIEQDNDNQQMESKEENEDQEIENDNQEAESEREDDNLGVENEREIDEPQEESEQGNDDHEIESEDENDEQHEESEQENEDQEIKNNELEVENDEQHEESEQENEDQEIENNKLQVENDDQRMESEQENHDQQEKSVRKMEDQDMVHPEQEVEINDQQVETDQENAEQEIEEEKDDRQIEIEHKNDDQQVESELENDNEQVESEVENDVQQIESEQENDDHDEESERENVEQEVDSEQENNDQQVESEQENDDREEESDQENVEQEDESAQENIEQEVENEEENDDCEVESEQENDDQQMESEKENDDQQIESEPENDDQQMESDQAENDQGSDNEQITDEIDATPDVSHDTTGRNREKRGKDRMPEGVLDYVPNNLDTSIERQNAASRMSKNLNISAPAIANLQSESVRSSFGARNSSAEGSGWDSHRTTRKTLRQTFGKDFTMRKSLRTLVMEKSAKRQTLHNKADITSKFPQANSTEIHEESDQYSEANCCDSPPEMPVEMYLEKVMQMKMESRMKMREQVRNSLLKVPPRDLDNPFKVPKKPMFPRKAIAKSTKPKAKPMKSLIPLETLPEEFIQDMKYKPPKRFQPNDASWITKRLYKHLETKLEAKYGYKKRVYAEKLVESIYKFAKGLKRRDTAAPDAVDLLKHELAHLNIVQTHYEFYEFFYQFLPREIIIKVVPDVVNRIPVPHGVFDNIIK